LPVFTGNPAESRNLLCAACRLNRSFAKGSPAEPAVILIRNL
jgi:hypothetical protein